jgi:NAD(P)-dependent dehydrogenase (short-subunit alcohol dehydrogenase family)
MLGPSPIRLEGGTAIVTGAGSGIGRACALSFAARGARVVVSDIDLARAETVASEINASAGTALAHRCDVSRDGDLEALRDRALAAFDRIDLIMNNVGVLSMGDVENIPLAEWQRAIDVNLLGHVRSNLAFLPYFIAAGRGHIVNTASSAGLLPYGFDRLPYVATKHAIVGLTEGLALYLAPKGVNVTLLCPAGVRTNIAEQMRWFGPNSGAVRAPSFDMVDAAAVGEMVAEAVEQQRFMVYTVPEIRDDHMDLVSDVDAYLARLALRETITPLDTDPTSEH